MSRNSRGRAFHNLDIATWKDLWPSMTLVLNVADARKIPLDDLKLYAPCDFEETNVVLTKSKMKALLLRKPVYLIHQ